MHTPFYWHPKFYTALIRLMYGRDFHCRYETLAALIDPESDVVEVCMGDAYLFLNYLRPRLVRYTGLDLNRKFVDCARGKRVNAHLHDLRREEVPLGDVVIIQGSLFHFIPDHREIVLKLQRAARKKLIVSEPVRNLVTSPKPAIRWLARKLTDETDLGKRFNEESFAALCRQIPGCQRLIKSGRGRDMIGVFAGNAGN